MSNTNDLESAHQASFGNKETVKESKFCGCFYCLKIFPSSEVTEWIPERRGLYTASCPYCYIDSVIPDASGFPIEVEFLRVMKKKYFS